MEFNFFDPRPKRYKRRHTEEFLCKENHGIQHTRSFESISKTNLTEETGIQPLSPDKKNCLFPKRIPNKKDNRSTAKISDSNEYNARTSEQGAQVREIPESFFLFSNKGFKENSQCKDFFNLLPDEMITKVLKWLPKSTLAVCCQVTKRLNRLCQDEVLWKRLDVAGRILSPNHLNIILDKKPVYARFSRTCAIGCQLVGPIDCTQLNYLDMSMSQIESNVLSQIFKSSPNLSKLSLEHLTITNEMLIAMETFSGGMDTLNLTMAYDIDAYQFASFLEKARNLEKLNLGCIKQNWNDTELQVVINMMPSSLDQLNISGFRATMTDNHTKILVRRCPSLVELDLSDCQEITNTSIEWISRKLIFLQHLCLSRCYNVEPACYKLLQHMTYLRYLELFSLFKDSSLRTLSASLPGIQINTFPLSAIARPTVGVKRSSIWNQRVRD